MSPRETESTFPEGDSEHAKSAYDISWEPKVAQRIRECLDSREDSQYHEPLMVAIVGIPGSGKTVSTFLLASLLEDYGIGTMVMPHDGYHYPLNYLKTCPDPEDLIYRRGAPDTFDPQSLLRDLTRIRHDHNNHSSGQEEKEEVLIHLPGFDHSKGDPEPHKHLFDRSQHNVVLCEGLYLLHDKDGWENIASLFDLKVFLNASVEDCMQRVKIRNRVIPGYTPEEIDIRTDRVDRVNAMTVINSKQYADIVVEALSSEVPQPVTKEKGRSFLDLQELAVEAEDISSKVDRFVALSEGPAVAAKPAPVEAAPRAAAYIGSWEADMAVTISEKVWSQYELNESNEESKTKEPFMVALVGIPGSGKSISVLLLLNKLEQMGLQAMVMPHDGYHYPLDYLKNCPDSEDLIYRRGAPETFDPASLLRDLKRIKFCNNEAEDRVIKLPGFDHAEGDPRADAHVFDRNIHDVVICEGLYLLHDEHGWGEIANIFDWKIFMDADVDLCVERVKIRNRAIPGYTPEEIAVRTEVVDRANALTVAASKSRADVVVSSLAMRQVDDTNDEWGENKEEPEDEEDMFF